jgi:hypothetical protein
MSWSNPDHSYNGTDQDNMDSSNGTLAKKLRVRNATASAPTPQDYRAEIKETVNDAKALLVDGKIRLESGGTYAGTIEPVASTPTGTLNINANATPADPHTTIGNNTNNLKLFGSTINLGADSNEIDINGLMTRVLTGELQVNTRISAHTIEPRNVNETLDLGILDGAQVSIGRGGAQHPTDLTIINTQLHVAGTTEFSGNNVIVDHDLDVTGILTGSMNDLDVNGNGDISGGLTVHGATLIQAATNVEQGVNTEATLFVRHNSAFAQQPALDVVSSSVQTAIRATGPTVALTTSGRTDFGGDLRVNSNTVYLGGTTPTGTAIRANGTRIEFLIGGTVHFYIDSTGGHNA